MLGGKNTFQKIGDAVINSTGTSDPSPVTCGARATLASTLFPVFEFSIVSFVPSGSASGKMIIAPLALTVCVFPAIGPLPFTWIVTAILSNTRCARRRSSAVGGRFSAGRTDGVGAVVGLAFVKGFIAPVPRNPSPAQPIRRRTPNRLPAVAFPSIQSRPNCWYRSPHWSTPAGAPASGHGPTPPCTRRDSPRACAHPRCTAALWHRPTPGESARGSSYVGRGDFHYDAARRSSIRAS